MDLFRNVVSIRDTDGEVLIHWYRKRCGKIERAKRNPVRIAYINGGQYKSRRI